MLVNMIFFWEVNLRIYDFKSNFELKTFQENFFNFQLLAELISRIDETVPGEIVVSLLTIVALYPVKLINM